jgi:Holliday junction resolvase RusA-like endonuclease
MVRFDVRGTPDGMTSIRFTVRGRPIPQGALVRSPSGGLYHRGRARLEDWRHAIATEARAAMADGALLAGAVSCSLIFRMPRPKSHFRRDGTLRPDAPTWCTSRPDGDKLERAAWDALTGVVWTDDAVVASWGGGKRYAGADGVTGVYVEVGLLQ